MCTTYYIRGTITVRVEKCGECKNDKLIVGVTPSAGFLSLDKSSPQAIAFPRLGASSNSNHKALLISLNGTKSCDLAAGDIQAYIPALLSIAGQNKPIELHLCAEGTDIPATKYKIVGFVYPAP